MTTRGSRKAAKQYFYFDGYRNKTFECSVCAWSGSFEQLEQDQYRELFDGSCPQCGKMLIIVSIPTLEEIHSAAASGNQEAQQMLPMVQKREELEAAFERDGLKSVDQLPDLADSEMEFIWDQESEEKRDLTIIRCGAAVIWKEPSFYESWPRFNQVKEIIKARYGTRFKSLNPTKRSEYSLYGDDLMAPGKISFT